MKIFLVLLTVLVSFNSYDGGKKIGIETHISSISKTFEIVEDALDYKDVILYAPYILNSKLLSCEVYEVTIDTVTWKVKKFEIVEGKY